MKVVTFACQKSIFLYTESSKVKPRPPYKVHNSINEAEQHLKKMGVNEIKVIEQ